METGFTWIMIVTSPHVWECLPTCTPIQHTNSHSMLNNDSFTRKLTPLLPPGISQRNLMLADVTVRETGSLGGTS